MPLCGAGRRIGPVAEARRWAGSVALRRAARAGAWLRLGASVASDDPGAQHAQDRDRAVAARCQRPWQTALAHQVAVLAGLVAEFPHRLRRDAHAGEAYPAPLAGAVLLDQDQVRLDPPARQLVSLPARRWLQSRSSPSPSGRAGWLRFTGAPQQPPPARIC